MGMINSRLETLTGTLGDAKVKMLNLYAERERNGLSAAACANAAGYSKSQLYNVIRSTEGAEYLELYSKQLEQSAVHNSTDVIEGEPLKVSNCLMMVYNQLSMKALRGEPRAIESLLKFSTVFEQLEQQNWQSKHNNTVDIAAILEEVAKM